jgi:hypothetical protein
MADRPQFWIRPSVQGPPFFFDLGGVRSLPKRWAWFSVNSKDGVLTAFGVYRRKSSLSDFSEKTLRDFKGVQRLADTRVWFPA